MRMNKAGHLLTAALLSLAGCQGAEDGTTPEGSLGAQEAQAQAQCVGRFAGISSCATGAAQLQSTAEGLSVSNLVNPSTDGVSSNFANAVGWSQKVRADFGPGQGQFSLAARDGDQVVSSLSINPDPGQTSLSLAPVFTGTPGGSSYSVNVYRDGVYQGGSTHTPSARVIIYTDWKGDTYLVYGFINWWDLRHMPMPFARQAAAGQPQMGACTWRLRLPAQTFTMQVDGGQVVGDEIELVEQIGNGAYPYQHFSGIDVKGSASAYNILGEALIQGTAEAR